MTQSERSLSRGRIVGSVLLGWFATLGFDFLLHGGLLAKLYVEPHPFLLPPGQAFRLIPLGYFSFLLIAILLAWLMLRLQLRGFRTGAVFGLKVGALVWASLALGLASISSAEPALLFGWFAGQTVEAALCSGVISTAFAARRLHGLAASVVGGVLGCVVVTVMLQSTGLAPAIRIETAPAPADPKAPANAAASRTGS